MPVRKYKTFEEAEEDLHRLSSRTSSPVERLRRLWSLASVALKNRPPLPRGVFRFRTFGEAQEWLERHGRPQGGVSPEPED